MPERSSGQRRRSDRRRLFDRRSPVQRRSRQDRRRGERRALSLRIARDRRQRRDRRTHDRRLTDDRRITSLRRHLRRRRETPTPYTSEELAAVRDIFSRPRRRPRCPSCSGVFALGRPRPRGDEIVRRVQCAGCGKAAIVTNSRAVRILVIEQKDDVRNTIREILAGAGHEVIEAADAGVGLRAFEARPPDLVFIDVHAPGRMDAPDFVRNLRKAFPDARVVAMASRPSYGMVDRATVTAQLGATRTIRMPFSDEDVLRIVEEARS